MTETLTNCFQQQYEGKRESNVNLFEIHITGYALSAIRAFHLNLITVPSYV